MLAPRGRRIHPAGSGEGERQCGDRARHQDHPLRHCGIRRQGGHARAQVLHTAQQAEGLRDDLRRSQRPPDGDGHSEGRLRGAHLSGGSSRPQHHRRAAAHQRRRSRLEAHPSEICEEEDLSRMDRQGHLGG